MRAQRFGARSGRSRYHKKVKEKKHTDIESYLTF